MLKMIIRSLLAVVALMFMILLIMGCLSRRLPDLKLWHRAMLQQEFRAKHASPGMTFDE